MALYNELSDQELTALLRQDDHVAFTAIYNRYWDKLLAISYNHTRDRSLAKEIVQNLFISLWNRKDNLAIENLANYLGTAIKFAVFKEYYRKQKREASLVGKLTTNDEYHIEDAIEAKFLQQYISGIVETLPEKCRLVFKKSREEHKSNATIAKELAVSEKTVEMHITKALKTIRAELKSSGAILLIAANVSHHWLK